MTGYPAVLSQRLVRGEDDPYFVDVQDGLGGPWTRWTCAEVEAEGERTLWWGRVVVWVEVRFASAAIGARWMVVTQPPALQTVTAHVAFLGALSGPPTAKHLGYEVVHTHEFEVNPGQSFTAARVPGATGRSLLEVGHVLFSRRGNLLTAQLIWPQRNARLIHPSSGWRTPLRDTQRLLPIRHGDDPAHGTRVLLEGAALVWFSVRPTGDEAPDWLSGQLASPHHKLEPLPMQLRLQSLGDSYMMSPRQAEIVGEIALPLEEGEMFIGRARDTDITLNHPSLARRHAIVSRTGDRVFFRDNGTANGCSLLTPSGPKRLISNDLVEINLGLQGAGLGDVFMVGAGALVSVDVLTPPHVLCPTTPRAER